MSPAQQFCAFLGGTQWPMGAFPQQVTLPYISTTQSFLLSQHLCLSDSTNPPQNSPNNRRKEKKTAVCWFSSLGWVRQATEQMRGAGWDQSWDQSNASLDSLKRSWIQILRAQSIFLLRCGIPSSSSSVLRK